MENSSKEKQIEEMARDLENHTCMSQYQAEIASNLLHIKGYRKASEVAREIFEEIDEMTNGFRIMNACAIIGLDELTELKKKYTESEDTK